jgi:hypothetical protein
MEHTLVEPPNPGMPVPLVAVGTIDRPFSESRTDLGGGVSVMGNRAGDAPIVHPTGAGRRDLLVQALLRGRRGAIAGSGPDESG